MLWLQAPLVSGHVTGEGWGARPLSAESVFPLVFSLLAIKAFPQEYSCFCTAGLWCSAPLPNPAQGSSQGNQVPLSQRGPSSKPVSGESGSPHSRSWGLWVQMQTASDRWRYSQVWAWDRGCVGCARSAPAALVREV